ncbi:MAG TPA: DUF1697 domain-containing protein [Magnetospirillum sp.]|nr:DUF1697 domain-containing protein [Magnetospirillum sp.]
MVVYCALLRAVNVGGFGTLRMADLRRLCEEAGLRRVRTYVASGNVVFDSTAPEAEVKATLEVSLAAHMGAPMPVMVRSAAEMAAIVAANPFPQAAPERTLAIFLDAPPPADALTAATGRQAEELRLGAREIYVHYGEGMARTRLRIPAAAAGTGRNMNTVAKLAHMAATD